MRPANLGAVPSQAPDKKDEFIENPVIDPRSDEQPETDFAKTKTEFNGQDENIENDNDEDEDEAKRNYSYHPIIDFFHSYRFSAAAAKK